MSDIQYKPKFLGDCGWTEAGLVPLDYQSQENVSHGIQNPDADPLHLLRCAVLVMLGSRKGSERGRLAALAVLLGLFSTNAEAATATKMDRATIGRALGKLRRELQSEISGEG